MSDYDDSIEYSDEPAPTPVENEPIAKAPLEVFDA